MITWSSEIMWQTKTIVCLLPQCLWPPDVARWQLTIRGYPQKGHMTHRLRGLTRLCDNLKTYHFQYNSAYGYWSWQCGDLYWWVTPKNRSNYISTITESMATKLGRLVTYLEGFLSIELLNLLATWQYIFTTAVPLATEPGRLVTYLEVSLPIKLNDPLMKYSYKITLQTTNIVSPLTQCLMPPNLAGWWLTIKGSHPYCHTILQSYGLVKSLDKLNVLPLCMH